MLTTNSLNQQVFEQNTGLIENVNTVSRHWALTEVIPLKVSDNRYVAKAVRQGSQAVILKVHHRERLFLNEYHVLTHYQGPDCIKLLDAHHECKALLLEQATPGVSLLADTSMSNSEKLSIYCQIAKGLKEKQVAQQSVIKHVSVWLRVIDDAKNMQHVEPRYYEKACELREKLLNHQREQYICHGDLHFGNIISRGDQWVVIDPIGVVAEMEFDVAACNLLTGRGNVYTGPDSSQILERATLLSKMLDLDLDRLLSWYFILRLTNKMRIG